MWKEITQLDYAHLPAKSTSQDEEFWRKRRLNSMALWTLPNPQNNHPPSNSHYDTCKHSASMSHAPRNVLQQLNWSIQSLQSEVRRFPNTQRKQKEFSQF